MALDAWIYICKTNIQKKKKHKFNIILFEILNTAKQFVCLILTHWHIFFDLQAFASLCTYTTGRCYTNNWMTYQSHWSPESVLFICLSKGSIGNQYAVSLILHMTLSVLVCLWVCVALSVTFSSLIQGRSGEQYNVVLLACASPVFIRGFGVPNTPWRSPICLICKALTSIVELHLPRRNVTCHS